MVLAAGSPGRDHEDAADDPGHAKDHVHVTDVRVRVIGADLDPDQNVLGPRNVDGNLRRAEEAVHVVGIVRDLGLDVLGHANLGLDRKIVRRDLLDERVVPDLAVNDRNRNPDDPDPSPNPDPPNRSTQKSPRTRTKREEVKISQIMERKTTERKLIGIEAKRNLVKRRNLKKNQSQRIKTEAHPKLAKQKRN